MLSRLTPNWNWTTKIMRRMKILPSTWIVCINTASHKHNCIHSSTFLSPVAIVRQCMCDEWSDSRSANVSNYSYIALAALASGFNTRIQALGASAHSFNRFFRCFVFVESSHTNVCHIEKSTYIGWHGECCQWKQVHFGTPRIWRAYYFERRERVDASDSSRRHQITHACEAVCTSCCSDCRWIGIRIVWKGLASSCGEPVSSSNYLRINVRGWIYCIADDDLLNNTEGEYWCVASVMNVELSTDDMRPTGESRCQWVKTFGE